MRTQSRSWTLRVVAALNGVALLFGTAYVFVGPSSGWWNVVGVLVLVAVTGSLLSLLSGRVPRWVATSIAATVIVASATFTLQGVFGASRDARPVAQTVLVLVLLIVGVLVGVRRGARPQRQAGWPRFLFVTVGVMLLSAAAGGLLIKFGVELPGGLLPHLISGITTPAPILLMLSTLSAGVLIAKWTRRPALSYVALGIAGVMSIVQLYPVAATLSGYRQVDTALGAAGVGDLAEERGFRLVPYLLAENLLPHRFLDVDVDRDVTFSQGEDSAAYPQDAGLVLKVDVYRPTAEGLPGAGTALVRIHGGGWSSGDKGEQNVPGQNEHFAAQGYTVFDVQYGLPDPQGTSTDPRAGDFAIDDIVRHIGIFTGWLADNADSLGVNSGSVFFSGGSAGGQLALAAGLASTAPQYRSWFDPRVVVRGIIPLFPAVGLAEATGYGTSPDLDHVIELITPSSPPALFFSGTNDVLTPQWISRGVVEALAAQGVPAGLVSWPWGEHGSDTMDEGPYAQTVFYGMERFLAQHRVDTE